MMNNVEMVKATIPQEIEVLWPMWRYGGIKPGKYKPWKKCRLADDCLWAWVPNPEMRGKTREKMLAKMHEKYGPCHFRPPDRMWGRNTVPVRLWTGRRYRWFWMRVPNTTGDAALPAKEHA